MPAVIKVTTAAGVQTIVSNVEGAHARQAAAAHAASAVSVAPTGAIAATNVQAALAELDTEKAAVHAHPYEAAGARAAHEALATAAHAASAVSVTPVGTVAATTVQAAITELDSEKETPAGAQTKATAALTSAQSADAAHAAAADPHGGYVLESREGAALGIATLDGGGKVPVAQLPSAVMTYEGVWNAATNSPALIDGTGDAGMVYRVSVAGTRNLGSGAITFDVGDYVIYNGTIWQKSDTTDAVASVDGRTGIVTLGDLYAALVHLHDATYVNETDHTKAAHDALALAHGSLGGVGVNDHHTENHGARHSGAGADLLDGYLLKGVTRLTTGSGTYTTPAGVRALRVRGVGGGGAGGGADGGAAAGTNGGGGGAGGYFEKLIIGPAATYAYGVGAAGVGVSLSAGGNGGDTTFGTLTGSGGLGGTVATANAALVSASGGEGGAASGGDMNVKGSAGPHGLSNGASFARGGVGGSSPFGGGGAGASGGAGGAAGTNSGAGGGGAATTANADFAGGNGGAGIIIIEELA